MPKFKIVVHDADVAHLRQIARNVAHNEKVHGLDKLKGAERTRVARAIDVQARAIVGPKRPAGTVHDLAATECPDGLENCRNCGDPEFADSCRAKGHCPLCGTAHGIAPDSVLASNGYRLEPA